jgi:hypothetical protein
VLLALVGALTFHSARSLVAMVNYADLETRSRNALDIMTREIRQANSLNSHSLTNLVFNDYDGKLLTYWYNAADKTLRRTKDNKTQVLLTECDQLTFSIYQRNPIGGSYDQYPTATPTTCKLVQLNWRCSRSILNARSNTESVQSAKVVIRKE